MSAPGRSQGFDALATFKDVVNAHHEIMGYSPAFPSEDAAADPACARCGGRLLRGDLIARCAACGDVTEVPQ